MNTSKVISPESGTQTVAMVPPADKGDFRPKIVTADSNIITLTDAQRKEIGMQLAAVKRGLIVKTVESTGRVGPNAELSTLVSTPSAAGPLKCMYAWAIS